MINRDAPLSGLASLMAMKGRKGDTMLAHITPMEAMKLKNLGGAGTVNPATGLLEFYDEDKAEVKKDADGHTYSVQGGIRNYAENTGDVKLIEVPENWKSGPDQPTTHPAFITEKEMALLKKANLHNKEHPDDIGKGVGPSGLPSYDGYGVGDADAGSMSTGGSSEGESAAAEAASGDGYSNEGGWAGLGNVQGPTAEEIAAGINEGLAPETETSFHGMGAGLPSYYDRTQSWAQQIGSMVLPGVDLYSQFGKNYGSFNPLGAIASLAGVNPLGVLSAEELGKKAGAYANYIDLGEDEDKGKARGATEAKAGIRGALSAITNPVANAIETATAPVAGALQEPIDYAKQGFQDMKDYIASKTGSVTASPTATTVTQTPSSSSPSLFDDIRDSNDAEVPRNVATADLSSTTVAPMAAAEEDLTDYSLPYIRQLQTASTMPADRLLAIKKGEEEQQNWFTPYTHKGATDYRTATLSTGGSVPSGLEGAFERSGGSYEMFSGLVEDDGSGDGMSDNVPFRVVGSEEVQGALLSPDEYVVDAHTMAAIGNGSPEAGAKKMDMWRETVREKAYGKKEQPKQLDGLAELARIV